MKCRHYGEHNEISIDWLSGDVLDGLRMGIEGTSNDGTDVAATPDELRRGLCDPNAVTSRPAPRRWFVRTGRGETRAVASPHRRALPLGIRTCPESPGRSVRSIRLVRVRPIRMPGAGPSDRIRLVRVRPIRLRLVRVRPIDSPGAGPIRLRLVRVRRSDFATRTHRLQAGCLRADVMHLPWCAATGA